MPGTPGPFRVGRDEGAIDSGGECDISSVVDRHVVSMLPDARGQRSDVMAASPEGDNLTDRLANSLTVDNAKQFELTKSGHCLQVEMLRHSDPVGAPDFSSDRSR